MSETARISPKRLAANRQNSGKSTGPTTSAGKARSSRNALKHGLTSQTAVLPNEDPSVFQEHFDQWLGYYQTDDPAQLAAIERAVSSKWKLDRCTRLETERLSEQVRHAVDQYDLDKFTEAESIGRRLVFEPIARCDVPQVHDPVFQARLATRQADNPAVLAKRLEMTAQGVDWLILRWIELAEMLRHHGFWHYPEKFRAVWLLGRRPEDVLEDQVVQRIFLACNIAHPDTDDNDPDRFDLWDECYQAKMGLEGRPMYFFQIDAIRPLRPADHLTAKAQLWEVFTKEITRLRALKQEHLDPIDRLDRASAQERAMFDGSKEGVLMRRYETAVEREFHKSIADLSRLRKEAVPDARWVEAEAVPTAEEAVERNEPIAEVSADFEVTSADLPRPRPEPSPSEPATPFDGLLTASEAIPGPGPAVLVAV